MLYRWVCRNSVSCDVVPCSQAALTPLLSVRDVGKIFAQFQPTFSRFLEPTGVLSFLTFASPEMQKALETLGFWGFPQVG